MTVTPDVSENGNGADASAAPVSTKADEVKDAAAALRLDAAQKEKISNRINEIRHRVQFAVGQIVLAMSAVPRYRHQSLADLQTLVLDPLLRDRVAIASVALAIGENGAEAKQEWPRDEASMAGVAIWASVSDEVDAKIREQIKAGVFPVRLKPEEWTSGDKAWLIDVIAPSQKLASAVLANFRQVVKEGDVRIHPIVGRMVDPELLKRLVVSSAAVEETKTA